MGHHKKNFRQKYSESDAMENDPLRIFIRMNRKNILIFLGVGSILLLAIIAIVGIFLFTKVTPVGMEVINKSSVSAVEVRDALFTGVKNWISQFVRSINVP